MQISAVVARFLAVVVLFTSVQWAMAEPAPVEHVVVPMKLDSGALDNLLESEQVAFEQIVDARDAPWIRLVFSDSQLAPGSRLVMTSLYDGATQRLDAGTLEQWGNTSAYFNGHAVRVRLVSAPGARGDRIAMNEVVAGVWPPALPESQCGPTDDRVPSSEPERARLLNIGCTASIYHENSCFITAGHCLSSPSLASIVQFNVPLSLPNGGLQHPPPEDQYSLTSERDFVNGGAGNDWGLFKVFPNAVTGLMPFEAQGASLTLATSIPSPGATAQIVGYGVDSGTANQTQQVSDGPIVNTSGTTLRYQADTEGGNSGSAVTALATDEVIGIHTHGGCNTTGSNAGTEITHPNLQAALNGFCDAGGGVACGDIVFFNGRCRADGTLQALAVLANTSHNGETITLTVDGNAQVVTIQGRLALYSQGGFTGTHTVSVSEPAACGLSITRNCP